MDPHFSTSIISESTKHREEPLVLPGGITQPESDTESSEWSITTFEGEEEEDLMVSASSQQLLQVYQKIYTPLNLRLQSTCFSDLDFQKESEVLSTLSSDQSLISFDMKGNYI